MKSGVYQIYNPITNKRIKQLVNLKINNKGGVIIMACGGKKGKGGKGKGGK